MTPRVRPVRIVDLTLPIRHGHVGHPRPPYTQHPTRVEFVAAGTQADLERLRSRGFRVAPDAVDGYMFPITRLSLVSHPFTHVDTPVHFHVEGWSTDQLQLAQTCGEAVILDFQHKAPGECIGAAELEEAGPDVDATVIPIIHTGWTDRAWGTPEFYTRGIHFHSDAADWFLARGVRAIACDCLPEVNVYGPDPPADPARLLHNRLLGGGVVFISYLTNLSALRSRRVMLLALPLKIEGAEAAPARVVAWELEGGAEGG